MEFSFDIQGIERIQHALGVTAKEIESELNKALYASAIKVEKTAKQSILDGQKSGRTYKRRTVVHRASAPDEPPASDTGRLVGTINSYLNTAERYAFVVAGRGIAKYASMLEFGTSKMAPRPFMLPALEKCRDWISERLSTAVANVVKSAGK